MSKQIKVIIVLMATVLGACGGSGGGESKEIQDPGGVAVGNTGDQGQTNTEDQGQTSVGPTPGPVVDRNNLSLRMDDGLISIIGLDNYNTTRSVIESAIQPLNGIPNIFNNMELPVVYTRCGEANASYDTALQEIILCDELVVSIATTFEQAGYDDYWNRTWWAMTFVLYHEFAHAVDVLSDLPIIGDPENAADAIATVIAVNSEQGSAVANFANWLFIQGDSTNVSANFASAHSNGTDRSGNIMCWLLGSDPSWATVFPNAANLFQGARDCTGEYADQKYFVESNVPELQNFPAAVNSKLAVEFSRKLPDQQKMASNM